MWRKLADLFFWVGLSLYFGGLITIGVIVPRAVFDTAASAQLSMPGIAAPPLDMSRQVGGEIFGAILGRFAYLEAAALALMLAGLASWILGHRRVRYGTWLLLVLWSLVAALTVYDAASLSPRVWNFRQTLRQTAAAHAAEGPSATWPERVEFDRLHARSESLAHAKAYVLLAMLLVTAWRTLRARGEKHDGDDAQFRDPLMRTLAK